MAEGIKNKLFELVKFIRKQLSGDNPDSPFYILILCAFVVFVLGTNLFVDLSEEISGKLVKKYDDAITDFIISFRTPVLNDFFVFITDMGDVYAYIIMTTIAAIFFFYKLKNKKFIFQLVGVLVLSALANIALKKAFDRARPTIEHMVVIETLSYPSGHAMSAMAFYGFLTYLIFKIKMSKILRTFLAVLFIFLILAIGISRIYLGVHFPTDVAGGFIAGLIWVALCIILFNIIDLLRQRKKRRRKDIPKEENLKT